MRLILNILLIISWAAPVSCGAQPGKSGPGTIAPSLVEYSQVTTGAMQTELYYEVLNDKSVGVVCNQSSIIGTRHLVDTLLSAGIGVKAIFSPEHGFRGDFAAGEEVDIQGRHAHIPVISLYGQHKKPRQDDLKGLEIMLFDIQDVGVRFYTYISTLALVMEACAEAGIPLMVLDRPNPNGFYIDGPVLDTAFRSFVGLHPVPVVYGMTIGEYARMINGESWLANNVHCDLTVIPLNGYQRDMMVRLPVNPSPNLPTWESVYLYPSLCFFEGTVVSVGRGTEYPFESIGHPAMMTGSYIFTPCSIPGVADKPPYEGQQCNGQRLTGLAQNFKDNDRHFTLAFLLAYYQELNMKDGFFNNYFDKLAGNMTLRQQILTGMQEPEIRKTWEDDLNEFRKIRMKYLLYPDIPGIN